MSFQKLMNRIVGILQVSKLASARRTVFTAGGRESFRDPVIAERAFLRGFLLRIDETTAVRTRLHAVAAAQAVFLVHQHHAVRTDKGCAHGTHLSAGRVSAVIAHLGNEEVLPVAYRSRRKPVLAADRKSVK